MMGNNMDRLAKADAEDEFYAHNAQLSDNDSFEKEADVAAEDHFDTFDSDFDESKHKEEGVGREAAKEDRRGRGKKGMVAVWKTGNTGLTLRLTRTDPFRSVPPVAVLLAPCAVPAAPPPVARQLPQRRNRAVLLATTRRFVHRYTSKRATAVMEKATLAASPPPPPPAKPCRKDARIARAPFSLHCGARQLYLSRRYAPEVPLKDKACKHRRHTGAAEGDGGV
mmetsp:Transcript_29298/g.58160  ORF Transcript_29298/g.58160 Transcript_29298/m.58160 type:complete len:224 (+) Transcript_29298:273-944(+)